MVTISYYFIIIMMALGAISAVISYDRPRTEMPEHTKRVATVAGLGLNLMVMLAATVLKVM